ncbi:MAG: hypothetical protein V3W37_09545 [Candidatus Binatia bacterium]
MRHKPPTRIPTIDIHWEPPGMPLIARRRIGPPHTLIQSSLQTIDMDDKAISLLADLIGRYILMNPPKAGYMTQLE